MANGRVLSDSFSFEIVESLLQQGANLNVRDETGLSVILFAAFGGNYRAKSPDLPLLNSLLERDDITRADKIDALETAGALLLAHSANHELFPLAFRYWRRALSLRQMGTEDGRPIHKTPIKSKNGELSEWSTLEDLINIESDPSQHEVQSLLVRLRIFSSVSFRASTEHFYPSIWRFFAKEIKVDQRSVSQILDICWVTLDTLLRFERPHESGVLPTLDSTIVLLFKELLRLAKNGTNFTSGDLKKAVELLMMMDPWFLTNPNSKEDQEVPVAGLYHLKSLHMIIKIIESQQQEPTEEIRLRLVQLIHRDYRDQYGRNVLHLVCLKVDSEFASTVRFLVKHGANLNARTNTTGYGVFHMLASLYGRYGNDEKDAAACLLLNLGAHLDMVDKNGETAADLWLYLRKPFINLWMDENDQENVNLDWRDLPKWLQEPVPQLKCLCARFILKNKLPFKETNLPAVLIPFVELH